MDESIEYTEPLTGTLAEAAEASSSHPLGTPYSPLAQMWQVNPGAEAIQGDGQEESPLEDK